MEEIIFDALMTLASNPEGNDNLVMTLRYLLDARDATRSPQDRLKIHLILSAETEEPSQTWKEMAVRMWRAQLEQALEVDPVEGPQEVLASLFGSTEPAICHIGKRESFHHLTGDAPIGLSAGDKAARQESVTLYVPWPYRADEREKLPDALFWDSLLDAVTGKGIPGWYVVDLVFRPVRLAPEDLTIWALERQLEELGQVRGRGDALAEATRKAYQEYLEMCTQGAVFEFGMAVAGTDPDGVQWLAGGLAASLTQGGRYWVKLLERSRADDGLCTGLERFRRSTFCDGFVEASFAEMEAAHAKVANTLRQLHLTFWSEYLTGQDWETIQPRDKLVRIVSSMARLRHLVGPDTAREFLRLPIPPQGYLHTIRLDTEGPLPGGPALDLGAEQERPGRAHVPLRELPGHMFVAGTTGSGKSTTLRHLLMQLWEEYGVPFLVIEPAKKEYRSLKLTSGALARDLIVFTVGQPRVAPLRFNPLRFGAVTLNEHLAMLETCFRGSMPFWEPLPAYFWALLEEAYCKEGWEGHHFGAEGQVDQDMRVQRFPLLRQIADQWASETTDVQKKMLPKYSGEGVGNIRGALSSRMMEWERSHLSTLFRPPVVKVDEKRTFDLPWEVLMRRPVVLELDALSPMQANLVTLFVLAQIREQLKVCSGPGEGFIGARTLHHVVVIEEAHNLVGRSTGPDSGENYVDPRAAATEFLVRMLAEVRALGEGLIIADQTPAAVAPVVLKNTNVKLAHRITDAEDRAALSANMLLDDVQTEELARLKPGWAYLYQPAYHRPIQLQVESRITGLPPLPDEELHTRQVEEVSQRLGSDTNDSRNFDLYLAALHADRETMCCCTSSRKSRLREAIILAKTRRGRVTMAAGPGLENEKEKMP
jgi:DNA helicase HerA-like ATPase